MEEIQVEPAVPNEEFKAVPKRKAAKRKANIGNTEETAENAAMEVEVARPVFPPVKRGF